MKFRKGSRVELKRAFGAPKGSCGVVKNIYKNGNLRIRITNKPNCDPVDGPTIFSIPASELTTCHCG